MASRRDFLAQLAALSVAARPLATHVHSRWQPRSDPFSLGIASGDPLRDGVVLWTRVLPEATEPPDGDVRVRWEVASDEAMRRTVRTGVATARADLGHAVHVDVRGLEPGRWYWYRFMLGDATTAIGRTRTAFGPGDRANRLCMAFASCQHYEWGHFTAHRHLAAEDMDVVCFLGDYIYEGHIPNPVRRHDGDEPLTLDDYRRRYALYKRDADLQAAHAAAPWVVTWDDHEVDNNYAGLVSQDSIDTRVFASRRAAAYRAYYEHMPLRRATMPAGPDMMLYRRLSFGGLASFHVLDGRQYRSDQACGDRTQPPCPALADTTRSMLGSTQERWLRRGLQDARTTWQVLAQQVVMMPFDVDPGEGERYNMDSWSGYPAARHRLTSLIAERQIRNVVCLTGDVHTNFAGEVPGPGGASVAVEYVGTSMTSDGDGSDQNPRIVAALPGNPHVKYHGNRRGYVRCEITPQQWRSEYRAVPSVSVVGSPISTIASFVTPAGSSRVERDT